MSKAITFYLVRHGQTYTNLRKMVIGGGGSAPLTPVGRQDAKYLGIGLTDVPFVAAYASPLERAQETAQLILGKRTVVLKTAEGLRDVRWGDFEGGLPEDLLNSAMIHKDDPLFPLGGLDTPDYQPPHNVESAYTFCRRLKQELHEIALRHSDTGGNILAVTHAALGSFLATLDPKTISKMDTTNVTRLPEVANTSVSIVTWQDGNFAIEQVNDLSYIEQGRNIVSARPPLTMFLFGDVETIFHSRGLLEGCSTSDLTEKGRKQAQNLANRYQLDYAAIYHSPLSRARELCQIVAADKTAPVCEIKNLRELFLAYWEAASPEALEASYPGLVAPLLEGGSELLDWNHPDGGEDGAEAAARLNEVVIALANRHEFEQKPIAVFTHPLVLKAFMARVFPEQDYTYSAEEPVVELCFQNEKLIIKK